MTWPPRSARSARTGSTWSLHLAGDGAALAELLTDKGRLASTLGFGADQHPAATVRSWPTRPPAPWTGSPPTSPPAGCRCRSSRTYPLAEVPAAFGDFAGGTLGKIAITVA